MNRKERARGRLMYLLPLMLALTGFAMLLLEWVFRFDDMSAFAEAKNLLLHTWNCLVFPIVLMFLFLFRIPPRGAQIASAVGAVLFLTQLVVAVLLSITGKTASGLLAWIPGHNFFHSLSALISRQDFNTIVLFCSDLCLMLTNLAATWTCLRYAKIKQYSDARRTQAAAEADAQTQASNP